MVYFRIKIKCQGTERKLTTEKNNENNNNNNNNGDNGDGNLECSSDVFWNWDDVIEAHSSDMWADLMGVKTLL